jgi:sterol desaturase/sphingolipid hydroxylase (fatty acid hydroxylase superfamily)
VSIDPLSAAISFLIYLAIFFPLERLLAMHRQRILRPALITDLCFLFGNFLLWTPLIVLLLMGMSSWIDGLPLAELRDAFRSQPFWLRLAEGILLSDLALYWFHRLCHGVGWLWRFHSVHHTAECVDWIAAYREHPLDNLLTRAVENLPLLVLGFPMDAIAGFVAFRGLWALFIHSNIDASPGPLRFLLGSPRLHHWHHEAGSGRTNFGNLNPLMDLLFGTYHDPGHAPERYGVAGEPRRGYLALIARPLVPDRLWLRGEAKNGQAQATAAAMPTMHA